MAVRVGVPVAALAVVPLVSGAVPEFCAVGAVTLFAAAATFRWWNQLGVEAVRTSIRLGAIPLAAGLAVQWAGVQCETPSSFAKGDLVCLVAALIAGVGIALWAARTKRGGLLTWPMAVLTTSLTATLGCVGLGVAALFVTVVTLAASSAVVWIPLAARAR
jgi:hypothetical protein